MVRIKPIKSAADDLIKYYWRHHAKWDMPSSLRGKQVAGEDLTQLANDTCWITEGLVEKIPVVRVSENKGPKVRLEGRRTAPKPTQGWVEIEDLRSRLKSIMAEIDGEEWYYFWGLHQILDILPQTFEKK